MARYDAIAVYIITNMINGTLYIGLTSNLIARVYQHKSKLIQGFTSEHGLSLLVWFEIYSTMDEAIHREKRLKKYKREQKIKLIESLNPEWKDLYPSIAS